MTTGVLNNKSGEARKAYYLRAFVKSNSHTIITMRYRTSICCETAILPVLSKSEKNQQSYQDVYINPI